MCVGGGGGGEGGGGVRELLLQIEVLCDPP